MFYMTLAENQTFASSTKQTIISFLRYNGAPDIALSFLDTVLTLSWVSLLKVRASFCN